MPSFLQRSADPRAGGGPLRHGDETVAWVILAIGYFWLLLWLAAAAAAVLSRVVRPPFSPTAPFLAFTQLANPSASWGRRVAWPWDRAALGP